MYVYDFTFLGLLPPGHIPAVLTAQYQILNHSKLKLYHEAYLQDCGIEHVHLIVTSTQKQCN